MKEINFDSGFFILITILGFSACGAIAFMSGYIGTDPSSARIIIEVENDESLSVAEPKLESKTAVVTAEERAITGDGSEAIEESVSEDCSWETPPELLLYFPYGKEDHSLWARSLSPGRSCQRGAGESRD